MRHDILSHCAPLALAAVFGLSGCASLAPGAAGKLAGLDPLSADPAALSLAAVMPVPTRLRNGDVRMKMSLNAAAPYGPIDEEFALEVVGDGVAPGVVVNPDSERLQILKIASADLERLRAAQTRARAYKASGARGNFTVGIQGGCLDGPLGQGPLIAAVFMRSSPGSDYFAMLKPVDLRRLAGEEAIAKLPACE